MSEGGGEGREGKEEDEKEEEEMEGMSETWRAWENNTISLVLGWFVLYTALEFPCMSMLYLARYIWSFWVCTDMALVMILLEFSLCRSIYCVDL